MGGALNFIATDYNYVYFKPSTLSYLESLDPNWMSISKNKRLRSEHAKQVQQKVRAVEIAAMTLAEIAWHAGETFDQI